LHINIVFSHLAIYLVECCFEELSHEVVEGERQDFTIACSRQLPYLITLTLRYQVDTATLSELLITHSLCHMYILQEVFVMASIKLNYQDSNYDSDSTE